MERTSATLGSKFKTAWNIKCKEDKQEDIMRQPKLWQRLLAEALGTFLLLSVGVGAVVSTTFIGASGASQLLVVALAYGLALGIAVTAALYISGGHINPAVTIGMLVARRISVSDAVAYILAQIAGATIAIFVLMAALPTIAGAAAGWGVPGLAAGITTMEGIAIEATITFFLVFSVFMTAANPKIGPKIGGLGVGLTLVILGLFAGPFTGAAANPAVFMGPAIATGNFTNWYVYWIGPVIGGIISAIVCEYGLSRLRK